MTNPISLGDLLAEIKVATPLREVVHCDATWQVSRFSFYARCPKCGLQIKVRSFAAVAELEDVFDAVFAWSLQPGARQVMEQRIQEIAADADADLE